MSEMTVKEKMAEARIQKDVAIKMILTYQSGNQYTLENLGTKTLKQLNQIYDKIMHR